MSLFKTFLFLVIANTLEADNKRIFSHDTLWKEAKLRQALKETYPGLKYGYYHWTGHWLQGALEDFDNDKILLLFPFPSVGEIKLIRNGKRLKIPPGKFAMIKVAGGLVTDNGVTDLPEKAQDSKIGYWLPLKITDRLEIDYKISYPAKVTFQGSYDPDNGWQTSCSSKVADQAHRKPADVYEISKEGLSTQILNTLKKKDECLIRLRSRADLTATRKLPEPSPEIEPMKIAVTDKIFIGDELCPIGGIEPRLDLYTSIAHNAKLQPNFHLRLSAKTDDKLLGEVLEIFIRTNIREFYLSAPSR